MANVQTRSGYSFVYSDPEMRKTLTIAFRIVDVKAQLIIKQHILAVMPQTFSISPASRDTLQHAAGGIHQDRWGRGAKRLAMTGVMLNEVTTTGEFQLDGESRFKDFRDLLEDFSGDRVEDTSETIKIRVGNEIKEVGRDEVELHVLILNPVVAPNSGEELSREWYEVNLPSNYFTFSKNVADRNQNFPFSLNLNLIRRLDLRRSPEDDTVNVALAKALLKQAQTEAGKVSAWAKKLKAVLKKTQKLITTIEKLESDFEEFARKAERFALGIDTIIRFPFRTAQSMLRTAQNIYDTYSFTLSAPDRLQGEIKSTITLLEQTLSLPSLFAPPVIGRDGREYRSALRHKVEFGDTLDRLAFKFGVFPEDIIRINNLRYPFLDPLESTDGIIPTGKRVARAGDFLLIPKRSTAQVTGQAETRPSEFLGSPLDQETRFYGTAWVLDEDGNMRGNSSRSGFLRISGVDNVKQALRTRLSTERGSFARHPFYGLERLAGKRMPPSRIEIARVDLHRQVGADPRVETVENSSIAFSGGLLDMEATVRLKSSEESVKLNLENLRVS